MDFNNDDKSILNLSVITLSDGILTIQGNGGIVIPSGTTAERPSLTNGICRLNDDTGLVEMVSGSEWVDVINYQPIIDTEKTRALNAESTISSNLLVESTSRQNADTTLQANINAESTLRSNADTTLTTNLNAEITRATNAEATNAADILVEKTRALAAEALLQPLDGDLTSIAGLSGTSGILRKTAADTWALDTNTYLTGEQTITLSGDVTGSGSTAITTTLATVNSNVGSFGSSTNVATFTVNAKGLITAASNTAIAFPVTTVFGRTGNVVATEGDYSLTQLSDVTITSPSTGQTLAYNGTAWVNGGSATSYSTVLTVWTLDTGDYYYADVTHNLGTQNILYAMHDTVTNKFVEPDSVTITNSNVIRVRVFGNTRSLRCVVLANGLTMAVGGSTPSSIIVQDDAVNITNTPHTILNFGNGLSAVNSGGGVSTISVTNTILRTFSWFATSLDNPNSSNWAINALAPVVSDPTNNAINVRQFNDTTEQGVGGLISIPSNAVNITFRFKARAQTAPGATNIVQPRIYIRSIPDNAAVGTWSAATNLNNISIPTNTNFQYSTQTVSLSSLGLSAGNLYQFELTRRTSGLTGGTPLTGNWLMVDFSIEFT